MCVGGVTVRLEFGDQEVPGSSPHVRKFRAARHVGSPFGAQVLTWGLEPGTSWSPNSSLTITPPRYMCAHIKVFINLYVSFCHFLSAA